MTSTYVNITSHLHIFQPKIDVRESKEISIEEFYFRIRYRSFKKRINARQAILLMEKLNICIHLLINFVELI